MKIKLPRLTSVIPSGVIPSGLFSGLTPAWNRLRDIAEPYVSFKTALFTFVFLVTLSALFLQTILSETHGVTIVHGPQYVYPEDPVETLSLGQEILPSHLAESDIPHVDDHATTAHTIKHIPTPVIDGLFEDTPFGEVPVTRNSDGMTIFQAYKAPFIPQVDVKGLISIVVLDYGLSPSASETALERLPAAISFVASPYAASLQHQIDSAKSSSHEVWLDVPFQLHDFAENDTGPLTLMSGLNTTQNKARLYRALSLGHGYAGIVIQGTPAFDTANQNGFADLMTDLSRRGIAVSTIGNHSNSLEDQISKAAMPSSRSTILLDISTGDLAFLKSLEQLEKDALDHYISIAYVPSQPAAFRVIQEWANGLSAKKLQLAPLSEAIRQQKE